MKKLRILRSTIKWEKARDMTHYAPPIQRKHLKSYMQTLHLLKNTHKHLDKYNKKPLIHKKI